MKVNNNSSINFGSINHPINAFRLKTNKGNIIFNEIKLDQKIDHKNLKEIASFFLDNFAAQSTHPFWKKCRKKAPEYDYNVYREYRRDNLINPIKDLYKNPDATILIGRKKNNKIAAAIVVDPLNISQNIKDKNTLYLDLLAVDKNYRKNNVAKNLIEKIFSTTKGRYRDCLLIAYNESVPFYQKIGFDYLQNNKLINELAKHRIDYPEYASFLIKNL